jgi:stress-induced-phosphoprotein 1
MSKTAAEWKADGNTAFKARDWSTAIAAYTKSVEVDPTYHASYSNRSQAHFNMGNWAEAAADGYQCMKVNPEFVKGYHRAANALHSANKIEESYQVIETASKRGYRTNRDLNSLYDVVKPKWDLLQAAKKRSLTGAARLKSDANDLFKKSKYDEAATIYSKALEDPGVKAALKIASDYESTATADPTNLKIAIDCLNNRALCYQQASRFSMVIADCTAVIEADPNNIKALFRRAQAFEGRERYRSALEDIRACLRINPNFKQANDAQHRLGRAVRMLRAAK